MGILFLMDLLLERSNELTLISVRFLRDQHKVILR